MKKNKDKRTDDMMEKLRQLSPFRLWLFEMTLDAMMLYWRIQRWYRFGLLPKSWRE